MTCNKLCLYLATTLLTVDEFCWPHHRLAMAKFSKSRVWGKVPEGSPLIFWRYPNFLATQLRIGQRKSYAKNQLYLCSPFDTNGLWQTNAHTQTDRHMTTAYTALAQRRAVNITALYRYFSYNVYLLANKLMMCCKIYALWDIKMGHFIFVILRQMCWTEYYNSFTVTMRNLLEKSFQSFSSPGRPYE